MLDQFLAFSEKYISGFHIPAIRVSDIVEMLLIAVVVYYVMAWMRRTKAWSLLKGLLVILAFFLIAAMFNMSTILFIAEKSLYVAATAFVVILQPELRRALEQLGSKNLFSGLITSDVNRAGEYSDHTIDEIVRAAFAMGRVKTGALMVLEREQTLSEYEKTGIRVDAAVSNQLIINIFEHNTPLHDGALIFRNDRIVSATCYLPLSDNPNLSKALGTRHRAGVGISEVTDALVIIVSEESGKVSVASGGELYNGLSQEGLREKLDPVRVKKSDENKRGLRNRVKGEKDAKKA
ncbi:MAG: diadenylate cyclase CdaA [Lachnospiraceae bacterium]|nr:diadenylate cyclase CdaA [Lachnospiraceae bacterium]